MKKLLVLAYTALLFAACSNDDGGQSLSESKEIRFSSELSLLKSTYQGTQIAEGQKVGIFIAEDAVTPTVTYTQNLSYTGDGQGSLSGTTQYFPTNGNSLKISAYHPYNGGTEDTYPFSVATDQTDASSIYASDLLYCPTFVQAPTDGQITLTFKHLLSQVNVSLTAGNGNPDLTDVQINIVNSATAIEFNRTDGSLGAVSVIQDVKLGDDAGAIVPQTINAGTKFIKIALKSGKELFYTLSEDLTLESSKKYTFNLVVNLTDVASIGTGVDEWNPGETIEGGATESVDPLADGVEYITDTRDGKNEKYLTGDFGTAGRWFLENLRYLPEDNSIVLSTSVDDNTTKSYFYPKGASDNISGNPLISWTPKMGLLYSWPAATKGENTSTDNQIGLDHQNYQGLCPDGWHVPSDYEWGQLITEIMDNPSKYVVGEPIGESWAMISQSVRRGQSKPAIEGGFDALFVASMMQGAGPDSKYSASFWSSSSAKGSEFDEGSAASRFLPNYLTGETIGSMQESRLHLNSVRCVKD